MEAFAPTTEQMSDSNDDEDVDDGSLCSYDGEEEGQEEEEEEVDVEGIEEEDDGEETEDEVFLEASEEEGEVLSGKTCQDSKVNINCISFLVSRLRFCNFTHLFMN